LTTRDQTHSTKYHILRKPARQTKLSSFLSHERNLPFLEMAP
jgi:hypothetical protein